MSAITDITEAWRGHSGLEVETFLKQMLGSTVASLGGKIGYVELVGSTLNFYDEEGGNVISTISLSGDVYNIAISSNLDQVFYVLADETSKILTFTPSTTVSPFGSTDSQPFPESYSYVLAVNNGGGYVPRATGNIASGGSASVDIRPFLANGDNYIRVTVTGDTSGQVRTAVFTGTLTTLTLSVSHAWQNVWAEGEDYIITGIRFAGNLIKTLNISVDDGEPYQVVYTANQSYTTTATTFTIPASAFPASENGVHEVKLWMTAQGVSTPESVFNILCVAEGDTTPLIAINAITPTIYNWTSGRLFSYAVYGADSTTFALSATLGGVTYPIASAVSATGLLDGTQYEFNYSLEVDTGINETPLGTLAATGTAFFDGTEGDSTTVTTTFDNTYSYLPTPNALFYMNASVRSNSETTSDKIVNEMGASQDGNFAASYDADWTGFGWYSDAWGADNDGYRALVVPAGSVLTVTDFAPLGLLSAYPDGMTFEIMMKNQYPADYDTPVLTLAGTGENPSGLFIYPTKIVLLGSYERSVVNQTVNISENRITHITVTLIKNYEGVNGRNLASIYINGISNVNFSFDASTIFGNAPLVIGQPDTDVYVYKMRVYGSALDSQSVFNNFLNSIIDGVEFTRRTESEKNNIFEGNDVDYEKVKAAGFNTMVVTMTDDNTYLPSIDHPAPSDGYPNCSMRFEYAGTPEKNVTVSNVSIDGQGTTSKKYYRWNLRAKTKSGTTWEYGDGTSETGKKGRFINDTGYVKCDRITAKKNYASSMQGHKMGFTGLYNDLYKQVGLGSHLPSSDYRVAVYQFPFVGFRYHESNDTYEFIGVYTAGPDKGSKVTFGYSDDYMSLMSIEGPNHAPRGTRFLHPWVDVTYDPEQETLCFGGEEGWDADYVNYETSTEGTQADWNAIRALYESEWRPAYECAYNNSPHIASLAEVIATVNSPSVTSLADVLDPANAELITGMTIPGYLVPIGVMEFYDTSYERYFFRTKTERFEKLADVATEVGDATLEHNLLTDLANYLDSQTPTTAQIIAARAQRFKDTMEDYWDKDQTLFHYCFCELYAVTDNYAKNSYPFKFLPLTAEGAGNRWGWRQDDMDTVMMTDNNGNNTKKYSVEPGDTADNVQIYQGYNSALWVLIHDNYADDIRAMMISIVNAASAIATSLGISGDGLHNSLFNLTSYYCWEHSAKYFSEMLYEKDRRWSYIQPWLENPSKEYNSVLPLTQALGDQYQAERLWMERRIPYMFSKYKIGAFNGATEGYNELAFTLAQQFTFHLSPAIDLYPTAATGSTTVRGDRTEAKDEATITLNTTGDTTNYIKGGDWLASLGDLSGMALTARGGGDITFSIICARLLDLKVGDEDPTKVLFNANSLSITTPSIAEIDARNTTTLGNLVDLTGCPRLRKVLFEGSNATGLLLAVGAKVTEVSFPAASRTLFLHSLPYLENENLKLPDLAGVSSVMIYNCSLNAIEVLREILAISDNSLAYVTAVWKGIMESDTRIFDTLVSLTGMDGNVVYENGSVQNVLGLPTVSGTIDITKTLYRNLIPSQLNISSDEAYGESYRKMTISNFDSDLSIIYDPLRMYPDPFVDDGWIWCYYNVTTTASATALLTGVSTITNQFGANFIIDGVEVPKTRTYTFSTTGEHLVKMYRNGALTANTWKSVTALRRIYFPSIATLTNSGVLDGCTGLTHLYITDRTSVYLVINGCTALRNVNIFASNKLTTLTGANGAGSALLSNTCIDLPALTSIGGGFFHDSRVTEVRNLGKITTLPISTMGTFQNCAYLTKVVLPETIRVFQHSVFESCTSLATINLDGTRITQIDYGSFLHTAAMRVEVNLPNLIVLGQYSFHDSGITKIKSLGRIRTIRENNANNLGAFRVCTRLTEATLPKTLVTIGAQAFYGCTALKILTLLSVTPPTIASSTFTNVTFDKIYVPIEAVLAYKEASGWSAFATKIEPIPGSTRILPEGYTRLDKVKTDTTAWVNTGVAGATDLEIGVEFYYQTYVQGTHFYGNYLDELHNANRAYLYAEGSMYVGNGSNLSQNAPGGAAAGYAHLLTVSPTQSFMDGYPANMSSSTLEANITNICLGNRSVTDPIVPEEGVDVNLQIYDFWIKKAGVEVLHYIPCERESDNKRGFYDIVNDVFKPSDSEVDFI